MPSPLREETCRPIQNAERGLRGPGGIQETSEARVEQPAAGSEFELQLEGSSGSGNAVVLLWGYDTRLADVSATLSEVYEFEVDGLPTSKHLPLPEAPHLAISSGGSAVPEDAARIYLAVYLDVDQDAHTCPGDFAEAVRLERPPRLQPDPRERDRVARGGRRVCVGVNIEQKYDSYTCRPTIPD